MLSNGGGLSNDPMSSGEVTDPDPIHVTSPAWKDDKNDFQTLLSLFRKYKTDQELDLTVLIAKVNPEATAHQCPYCKVVHEFVASRARKCPACLQKMVVRQGLFLTDDQAVQLEKDLQSFYEKQNAIFRVGSALETAQDYRLLKQNVEYLRQLAEGFRFMAQVDNQKDARGYSFWDKAWGYYNQARGEEMTGLRQDALEYTKLPDISWDMTQMLLDQSRYELKADISVRMARRAVTQACMTLAEVAKFGAEPYFITNLYALIKATIEELGLTSDDFKHITIEAASLMRLTGEALRKYENWMTELFGYQIVNLRS